MTNVLDAENRMMRLMYSVCNALISEVVLPLLRISSTHHWKDKDFSKKYTPMSKGILSTANPSFYGTKLDCSDCSNTQWLTVLIHTRSEITRVKLELRIIVNEL